MVKLWQKVSNPFVKNRNHINIQSKNRNQRLVLQIKSTIESRTYQILYKQKQESNSAILPMVMNPIPESNRTSLRFQQTTPWHPMAFKFRVVLKDNLQCGDGICKDS